MVNMGCLLEQIGKEKERINLSLNICFFKNIYIYMIIIVLFHSPNKLSTKNRITIPLFSCHFETDSTHVPKAEQKTTNYLYVCFVIS